MEFERKTGCLGGIGIMLTLAMLFTILFRIPIPEYLYVGINIVGMIFIALYVVESFIVFFKNTDKYK